MTNPTTDIPMPSGYGGKVEPDFPMPEGYGGTSPPGDFSSEHSPSSPDHSVNLKQQAGYAGANLLSLADMVGSIPAATVGSVEDLAFRVRGKLKGQPHKQTSEEGNLAFNVAMEKYGNPFSKLLQLAGFGREEGETSTVDGVMQKATNLIGKGGEWVEKNTNGTLNKEDVTSLTNWLMALGGGKGLKAGMEKMAKVVPDAVLGGVKLTPEAEARTRQLQTQQSEDPMAASKVAEEDAAAAEQAQVAKTRLVDPKNLVFDPVKGELKEAPPEPGKPLPKPTSLESALEKEAGGRRFDLTAEERIALKEWKDSPPPEPIVDESGKVLRSGGPRGQRGSIDSVMLARLGAIGLGATAGLYFSDSKHLEAAFLGGLGGFALSQVTSAKAIDNLVKMAKPDTRLKINELADAHEKYTQLAAVDVWSLQKQMEELVPKEDRRNAITHAIEAGDLSKLSPKEQAAAKIAQDYFDGIGRVASLEGIVKSARDNYVTHIWDWSQNKGLFEKWMDRRSGAAGMGTHNRFAEERSIPTIEEGKKAGLKPVTEDISRIMGIYGNSMSRSIANSVFTRALKLETDPAGRPLVMAADKAPHSYVPINNPNLFGLRVHPDIAPSLKMLYDTSSPGAAMKIMQGLSDTTKRVAVSFSLFHAKALTDAMIGGSSNPFKAVTKLPGFVMGTDKYLQELRKGSASPIVERAAEGGLKFSLEGEGAGVEDAGAGFYGSMSSVQGMLDRIIPGAGLPIKGVVEMNHKLDTFMWARLHAGMKLNMFAEKYQQLLDNSARDPAHALTPDQAARIAASYTNDLFGGLNWRRVAEDAKSRFGREMGQAMLNPGSRRIMQLLMFAPDWTVSTTRAAVKAFGKPDFLAPKTLAGLHQQYLLRSAVYYLIVGDAINHAMSGHHLWQNKDPTVLDMDPKGERHMQFSKHFNEPWHWLMKPGQQAVNKLGVIPRETIEQTLGVEYLSAKGRMPPMENRLAHLAKNLEPIAVQQGEQGGGASVVSGFAGVPIYGKTAAQRKEEKRKRDREHKKKPKVRK